MMKKMTLMTVALCVSQTAAQLDVVMGPDPAGKSVGSNVGAAKPQQPVIDTFLENGAFAWADSHGGKATFQDFPQHYIAQNAASHQFKVPLNYAAPVGTYANYRCPNQQGPCDVVVFAYECNGCGRALKTGDLFKQLTNKNFERTRCAPTFTTGKQGGRKYQMVAYVKTLQPGQKERIELHEVTHFVAFAMSEGGAPACSSLPNLGQPCEVDTNFRCQLKGGVDCSLRKCVAPGPGLGCQSCPLEEY